MTDNEIIGLLDRTGHIGRPFDEPRIISKPRPAWNLNDDFVRDAVESYQSFHAPTIEPLIAKHHPHRMTAAVRVDGHIGPATLELFTTPRCMVADHMEPQSLVGSGSWKSCHNIGDFHCATVKVVNDPPSFLEPVFDAVLGKVIAAYADIGLLFKRDDNASDPNIEMSFVNKSDGWIGLAIVGQNEACGSTIWCRFLSTFRPRDIISGWSALIAHEFGHNAGLGHTSQSIMNPYLIEDIELNWRNDPTWPFMKARYGGEPVHGQPPGGEKFWDQQGLKDSKSGEELWVALRPPIPRQ